MRTTGCLRESILEWSRTIHNAIQFDYLFIEPKRATRRRHKLRMINKAIRIQRLYWRMHPNEDAILYDALRSADNLVTCSCYMCGNPRKWFGLQTFQEYRENITTQEQYDDLHKRFSFSSSVNKNKYTLKSGSLVY